MFSQPSTFQTSRIFLTLLFIVLHEVATDAVKHCALLFWVSTRARLKQLFADENSNKVCLFNPLLRSQSSAKNKSMFFYSEKIKRQFPIPSQKLSS